jgi:small subunit ribosomal protein S2
VLFRSGELTGVKVFTKKYPAGVITNTALPNFFETELIFICDPWLDKNALNDAVNIKKKVMGFIDTNNLINGVNFVIPASNKGNKSLGLLLWIVAREYMHAHKINKTLPDVEEFIGEKLEELPAKEKKREKAKEEEKKKDEAKIESILKLDKATEGV